MEPIRGTQPDQEVPPPLVVLGVLHGVVAAAALRLLFGVVLEFHRSGGWPTWVVLPAVLYLSAIAAFCGLSCYGLLARRDWAVGETRRALAILVLLFPVGTVWGVAWLAYLKRQSRPAPARVPGSSYPPPPPATPAEPPGGMIP